MFQNDFTYFFWIEILNVPGHVFSQRESRHTLGNGRLDDIFECVPGMFAKLSTMTVMGIWHVCFGESLMWTTLLVPGKATVSFSMTHKSECKGTELDSY
jgi:hypothetical protein